MGYDFNKLELAASALKQTGRDRDALRIYLFMADGDASLDGGYLGGRIAECYERVGDIDAARYWYGRAVEENPAVRISEAAARERLGQIAIEDLVGPQDRSWTAKVRYWVGSDPSASGDRYGNRERPGMVVSWLSAFEGKCIKADALTK